MKFFKQIPEVDYNGIQLKNIILKSSILKEVFDKRDAYYPYIIKDGERADTIAYDYYGRSDFDWVVYYSNSIVDPYYEWPLNYKDFLSYLEKKYGTTVNATKTNIVHYEYTGIGGNIETTDDVLRKSWLLTPETYGNLSAPEQSGWTLVYAYDYEQDLNNTRRSIRLLDSIYLDQIKKELSVIFLG